MGPEAAPSETVERSTVAEGEGKDDVGRAARLKDLANIAGLGERGERRKVR